MKNILVLLGSLALSSLAHADVCGIVTRDQAELTLSFLAKGAKLERTYATTPEMTVQTVSVTKSTTMDGVDYFDLKVNGEAIDPGHTNIIINSKVSLNLGRLVGCDVFASDPHNIVPTPFRSTRQK